MFDILRRLGMRLSRGLAVLVVLLMAATGLAAAFWIGPLQPVPAELELLAEGEYGRFGTAVRLPAAKADPAGSPSAARFPVRLAVRNDGARGAQPRMLALSVPARYRLTTGNGRVLQGQRTPNNPLVRYRIGLPGETILPGEAPTLLTTIDTLWLAAVLPEYYCALTGDGVPEFVPAPVYDAGQLAHIQVFYSFAGEQRGVRQTGVLRLQLDSALLHREPAATPPEFPVTLTEPAAALPELGSLVRGGFRDVECGDPLQPIALQSVLWLTASGGRFFVLYHRGVPRKYLFDLNADDVVELELWDPDGDGDLEARRPARFALPDYLMPPSIEPEGADSVPVPEAPTATTGADTVPARPPTVSPADTTGVTPPRPPPDTTQHGQRGNP